MQMPRNRCAWITQRFHKHACHHLYVSETAMNQDTCDCECAGWGRGDSADRAAVLAWLTAFFI